MADRHLSRTQTIYWTVCGLMVAAALVTLALMSVDPRTIGGYASVWTKPLKFEVSLALHAATLALACKLLSPTTPNNAIMWWTAVAFAAACVAEMSYIILQGARGEHSHFNVATPFLLAMWNMMAIAAVVILGAAAVIGLAVWSDRELGASATIRTAITLGFVGGTILTLVTAFTIGGRMSPYVGGIPGPDARMALTGWSKTSGDLRVSHFLATHVIQAVPLFGIVADRIAPRRTAMGVTIAFAAAWAVATMLAYRTALQGVPSSLALLAP